MRGSFMRGFRSGNPALRQRAFEGDYEMTDDMATMTLKGTVNKIILMLILVVAPASVMWYYLSGTRVDPAIGMGIMIGGIVLGLIFALLTIFIKKISPFTAPLYAISEGAFLGGFSLFMETVYPGIVMQAVGLTFGIAFALLFAYKTKIIKPTQNFRLMVFAGTVGIGLLYLVSWILSMVGVNIGYIHGSGPLSIVISLVIVVMASLNLVLDFDFIENASDMGLPKYMEWYAAFGLMVTLIWLYLEIIRLLSKLRSR